MARRPSARINLSPARRDELVRGLQALFRNDFDEQLSDFRAAGILDLMLRTLGPAVYNQAVQDVRAHLQTKLDDLEGEIFLDDKD